MRFLSSAVVLLAICGLAAAGHLYHHQQHHSQHGGHEEHGSSYAVVSKHEEPAVHEYSHGGSGGGHHEYVHFEHQGGYSSDGGHSEGGHAEGGHDDGGYDAGHDEIHGHEDSHDYHAHPKYEFDYSVKDEKSGDNKNHWETRDGDKVKGGYTFKEADGTTRVVEYTADHKNGFNAVVKTVGHPHVEHDGFSQGGHESHDYSHYGH